MNDLERSYRAGQAARLQIETMNAWLNSNLMDSIPSEIVEWCRTTRDLLVNVAELAPRAYSPGRAAGPGASELAAGRAAGEL